VRQTRIVRHDVGFRLSGRKQGQARTASNTEIPIPAGVRLSWPATGDWASRGAGLPLGGSAPRRSR
jgi:hypothetical protein